jgi:hypothetical protein
MEVLQWVIRVRTSAFEKTRKLATLTTAIGLGGKGARIREKWLGN